MDIQPSLPRLEVHLLGAPEIRYDGRTGTEPVATKARAVLYYLAHTGRAHTRATLAELLWGDYPEEAARGSLRKALMELSETVGSYLLIERQTARMNPARPYWVDAVEFAARLERAGGSAQIPGEQEAKQLAEAIALYRADFLQGFYVRNAPDFEQWMLAERARLRDLMLLALDRMAVWSARQGDPVRAIGYARRQLELEPWREESHRQLMEWLALDGQRSAALAQYELCRRALAEELDVAPSPATTELYERLLRQAPGPAQTVVSPYALVGRRAEWQALYAAWQRALAGHASFVCIAGEAGIGKSRLAEELLLFAQRQGHHTARSRAYALEGRLAYAPVAEWLRAAPLQGRVAQLGQVWRTEVARLLPEILVEQPDLPAPEPLAERWQQQRFYEALVRAFTADPRPLLLVLDDLQWCDAETLAWLQYVLQSTPRARLLVVGTVRGEEVDDSHPLTALRRHLLDGGQLKLIELSPLSREETAALGSQVARQALDAEAAAWLYQETAGNPLFIVESMQVGDEENEARGSPMAAPPAQGDPGQGEATGEAKRRIPPKVAAVLQARLAQLSPPARTLAHMAAVAGRAFRVDLLVHAAQLAEETVVAGVDELWRRQIVREVGGGRYDFTHDRIRDVAYITVPPAQRRLYHRRMAWALERLHPASLDAILGELGYHQEQAGAFEEAAHWYRQAAGAAKQLYAHTEVVSYLERALDALRQQTQGGYPSGLEIELLHELGLARIPIYGWGSPPVGEAWGRAYELALRIGTPFQQCRALMTQDTYHRNRGRWRQAREFGERGLALAKAAGLQDRFLLGHLYAGYAGTLYHLGELSQAMAYFAQALPYCDASTQPTYAWFGASVPSNVYLRSSKCLWLLGFPDQARAACVQAAQADLTLASQNSAGFHQSFSLLDFSAMLYSFLRDVEQVKTRGEQLIEASHHYGSGFYMRAGRMYVGWALAHQGDVAQGLALVQESLAGHRRDGTRMFEPYWRSILAEVLALAGETAQALSEVNEGLAFAEETGNVYWSAHLLKLKGDYLLALATPDAEQWYQQALEMARRQEARLLELRAATALARLWQQQGQRQEARRLLGGIYGWFTEGFDTADLQAAKALLEELESAMGEER